MRVDSERSAGQAEPSPSQGAKTSGEWPSGDVENLNRRDIRHDPVVARWLFFFGYLIILDRESAR
jgi:hypothetical protein